MSSSTVLFVESFAEDGGTNPNPMIGNGDEGDDAAPIVEPRMLVVAPDFVPETEDSSSTLSSSSKTVSSASDAPSSPDSVEGPGAHLLKDWWREEHTADAVNKAIGSDEIWYGELWHNV